MLTTPTISNKNQVGFRLFRGEVLNTIANQVNQLSLVAKAQSTNSTVGAATLTAAQLASGLIVRSGSTAAYIDTTDTGTALDAQLGVAAITGAAWELYIQNTTAFSETITAGTGITLSGETVIPANSTGIFLLTRTGAGTYTMVGLAAIGLGGSSTGSPVINTNITTVGAGTLTAAALVGGVITRSGSTAAFTDTTDTAANIIAALPNAQIGESWNLSLVNTTAFAETVSAGAGVTVSGIATPLPGNATADFLCTYTAAGAVTMYCTRMVYNAAGGFDPNNVQTQFGSGTGLFNEEGNISRQVPGVTGGVNPGATGTDNVIGVFSIPASSFDQSGRGVTMTAAGNFAATANNKRCKLIINPATAVLGSTVGAGGITISDTGTVAQNGGAWVLMGSLFKRGALASNTQVALPGGVMLSGSHVGASAACQEVTATESGAILLAVTGNATTATTDILLAFFEVNAMN